MLLAALAATLAMPVRAADHTSLMAAMDSISTGTLKRHVYALADDTFEGREAGSRGGRAAAGYVVAELEKYGLKGAAGGGNFFQNFGSYRNILAILEGSDPELKSEYVLVGAHFDHVGYGNSQNSYGPTGRIHNGADDNASGTAGMLEAAEACAMFSPRPRRSIVFAFWDAEEKGLLGSKHWASQPTLPLDKLVLAINIDMIGRMRQDRLEISGARTAANLRQLASLQNAASSLVLDFNWETKDNSDHWSFYSRGIPFLMLHTGLHYDYHRPSDDAEKLSYDGLRRIDQFLVGVVHELADQHVRAPFRTAARRESNYHAQLVERAAPAARGRLGVTLEPQRDPADPVRIRTVTSGSPAATGGLLPGDEILRVTGTEVASTEQLQLLVLAATAPAEVFVRRAGQVEPLPLSISLDGAPVRIGISWSVDAGEPSAVILTRVVPGSPGQRAGLAVFDRVYRVGGSAFADANEFHMLLDRSRGPIELVVERDGKIRQVTVEPLFDLPTDDALGGM